METPIKEYSPEEDEILYQFLQENEPDGNEFLNSEEHKEFERFLFPDE